MGNKVMSAAVPKPLADRIDVIAARLDRSNGWIVNQALTAWVERQEDRYHQTLQALAEVDSGASEDHKTVEAWANGLRTEKS